jgi:rifampin ADP-ribosylating transferase
MPEQSMDFDPRNRIVQLCIRGIVLEEKGEASEAAKIFLEAWDEADDVLEKYLAAYFVARTTQDPEKILEWFERALDFAKRDGTAAATSSFPTLYSAIAKCFEELGDAENARKNFDLANSFPREPADSGPFYHGTRADLKVGDLLTPGGTSNYQAELVMNHIYFTALPNGAGLAASLAKGDGRERVYVVEPTGPFENDPNVTDKKFPGNPTRSYRSAAPLRIVAELESWLSQTPEELSEWREKLASGEKEIIN